MKQYLDNTDHRVHIGLEEKQGDNWYDERGRLSTTYTYTVEGEKKPDS